MDNRLRGQWQIFALIPGFGWILALVLASVAVFISGNILHWVQITVLQLILLGLALFLGIPAIYDALKQPRLDQQKLALIIGITLLLIIFGIPNLILSAIGQPAPNYSIVPKWTLMP